MTIQKYGVSRPLVSIIVAVRNAEATLERTLQSALRQTYERKEIIVIDGASTDGTVDVAKKFNSQLGALLSEPDKGIADAYNKGIDRASGDWVYFLNADDVFSTDAVLAEIFEGANLDAYDLVVGRVLEDRGKVFKGRYSWVLLIKNTVHHQAIFYRGVLLKKHKYNSDYRRYGHDHEHNLMLWKLGAKVRYLDKVIALWSSAGISNNAAWRDYREEFKVRQNVVGGWSRVWNVFTFMRFGLKQVRRYLQS